MTKKDYYTHRGIKYYQHKLSDSDDPSEIRRFMLVADIIVDSIHTCIQKGAVLVHCEMGIQRSPAIVAYYLMKYYNMSSDDAIEFVKNSRDEAFKHRVTFLEALYKLELLN